MVGGLNSKKKGTQEEPSLVSSKQLKVDAAGSLSISWKKRDSNLLHLS
jgi:hypothetical protein